MNLTVKPLGNQVLIEPDPAEKQTAGGIIIPDSAKQLPEFGTVVAIPEGNMGAGSTPVSVKIGDRVLFRKGAGMDINISGHRRLIIMAEKELARDNILAIIE